MESGDWEWVAMDDVEGGRTGLFHSAPKALEKPWLPLCLVAGLLWQNYK